MVLPSVRRPTGKSKPLFAIPVELNVNLSGHTLKIHDTGRGHGASAPAIGR